MLNLNDLLVFVQVVDHGGFAAAGRALGIPKSTLSKRLSELEKAIDVRLVQRTSRSFAVTDIGRDLYRHASAMLIEAEAAEKVIKGRLAEPSGAVRITASMPIAQCRLAPMLPRLAARYPKVRIMLDVSDRFIDIVQEGFDIAIRNHFAPLPDTELVQRRIDYDPAWLVASPDFIREHGMPSRPEEANGLNGVVASSWETVWTLQDVHGTMAEVAPSPRYIANETVCLLEAARAGLGVACLAGSFCAPLIESGALIRILPDWTAGGVMTTLLMPHRRGQLPSVRIVADHLIAEFSRRTPSADL
jgi:DNA-binding transcriptional LysR family regulator